MNLKCFCWDYKTLGRGPCSVGGGDCGRRKEAKGLLAWWGCCKRDIGDRERDNMGLNRPPCLWSFPYACLSLGISRPPAVKMRPRTLTCIDLDSVCPMLIVLFIYLLFSSGTGLLCVRKCKGRNEMLQVQVI